jgi:hypothetical protein
MNVIDLYICYVVDFRCLVLLSCCWLSCGVCHKWLGTIDVVVVVVKLYVVIHKVSPFAYSWPVEGLCPGMFIIHLLRAYALGCFNHPNCWGLMPWNACHSTRVKWYHMHIALVVVVVALSKLSVSVELLVSLWIMKCCCLFQTCWCWCFH